jgi:hypothetical protein
MFRKVADSKRSHKSRFERNAFVRAELFLDLPPDEKVLEFDIGSLTFVILPDPFPQPIPSSAHHIDLVVSETALYAHAGGSVARYPWRDVLEVTMERSYFKWLLVSGSQGQVDTGRSPRSLAETANAQLRKHEEKLSETDKSERKLRTDSIHKRKATLDLRNELLRPNNQYYRSLGFEAILADFDGIEVGRGHPSLVARGVEIISKDLKAWLIPFESLSEFVRDTDTILTARISSSNLESMTVSCKDSSLMDDWMEDLKALSLIKDG